MVYYLNNSIFDNKKGPIQKMQKLGKGCSLLLSVVFNDRLSILFRRGWFLHHPAGNCHREKLQACQHCGVLWQLHKVRQLLWCSGLCRRDDPWLESCERVSLHTELISCGSAWSSVEEAPSRMSTTVRTPLQNHYTNHSAHGRCVSCIVDTFKAGRCWSSQGHTINLRNMFLSMYL